MRVGRWRIVGDQPVVGPWGARVEWGWLCIPEGWWDMPTIHKKIRITIIILDVDKQPISNAEVTCTWVNASAGTGPSHSTNTFSCEFEADIPLDRVDDVRITVNHPHFTTEVTTIHPDGDYWSNPTCTITASVTNPMPIVVEVDMSVTFVLGRARLAPMAVEVITPSRPIAMPSGVLPNTNEAPAGTNYRLVFSGERSFLRLREHVIGDPTKDDWERLAHAPPVAADASREGYFRWIEVREGSKKFAVAIWAPKNYFPQPGQNEQIEALDFIVFYSPTTAGKDDIYKLDRGHTYPYGLRTIPDPKDKTRVTDWNQPFIFTLGQKYLFDRLHLTFQLIAANKKAIIVMPINAYGDWGPFTHKQGVHRLLLEIAQFSCKNFMAPLGKPPASRRKYKGIPPIGKVVIAGFSSGSVPILELFRDKENVPGLSYVKDSSVFDKRWTEFWDLDLEMEGADKLWMGHFHRFLPHLVAQIVASGCTIRKKR